MKLLFGAPLGLLFSLSTFGEDLPCYRAMDPVTALLPRTICVAVSGLQEDENHRLFAILSYSLDGGPLVTRLEALEYLKFELHYTVARLPILDLEEEFPGQKCEDYERHFLGVQILLTPDNRLYNGNLIIDARSYLIRDICENDQVTGRRTEYRSINS